MHVGFLSNPLLVMENLADPLTLELLEWISRHSATYAELMEVWRSNCPRHSTWEDAVIAGFVAVVNDKITLTPRGRQMLNGVRESP